MKEAFFQILPHIQRAAALVSQGLKSYYSVIFNILKRILDICIKNDSFFIKFLTKASLK